MANKDHLINDESELGTGWIPVENPSPIIPGRVAAPPVDALTPIVPKYNQGSLPPSFQHDASFVDTEQPTPNAPKHALMPLGLSANSVSSAQITSVVKTSQTLVGGTVLLETNGLENPNQSVLNLEAGSGVTLSSDAAGGVTISSSGGDGLTHLDPVWEYDSAYTILRDDFIFGNSTSGTIGELGWVSTQTIGGAGGLNVMPLVSSGFPYNGGIGITTSNTTANRGFFLSPSFAQAAGVVNTNHSWDAFMPLLDYPGWKVAFVFGLQQGDNQTAAFASTQMSMYVGLGASLLNVASPGRPPIFFGCRFDTDTTAPSINDTTFHLEACMNPYATTRNNTVGTNGGSFDTGIVPSNWSAYRLEISCVAAGSVTMSLSDGTQTVSHTFTVTKLNYSVNTGGFGITVSNGVMAFPTGGQNFPVGPGAKWTVSGMTFAFAPLNGFPFQVTGFSLNNNTWTVNPGVGSTGNPGIFNVIGYPVLAPFFSLANDTSGGPASFAARYLVVDYFSLVWNKGLQTGGATPNSIKPRGW